MDENTPKPFNDVSHPGVAPAAPSSRPVIVSAPQADPMMTSSLPQQPVAQAAAPATPAAAPAPAPATLAAMTDVAPAPAAAAEAPKPLDLSKLDETVGIEEESAAPGSVVIPGAASVNHVSKKPRKTTRRLQKF